MLQLRAAEKGNRMVKHQLCIFINAIIQRNVILSRMFDQLETEIKAKLDHGDLRMLTVECLSGKREKRMSSYHSESSALFNSRK